MYETVVILYWVILINLLLPEQSWSYEFDYAVVALQKKRNAHMATCIDNHNGAINEYWIGSYVLKQ